MKTTLLQKQHEKALAIIEMINRIDHRIEYAERDLAEYKKLGSKAWQKFIWVDQNDIENRLSYCKIVSARLEKYYQNTINKINLNQC
jgi:hypothetical protein